jgi:hypothetical protein
MSVIVSPPGDSAVTHRDYTKPPAPQIGVEAVSIDYTLEPVVPRVSYSQYSIIFKMLIYSKSNTRCSALRMNTYTKTNLGERRGA